MEYEDLQLSSSLAPATFYEVPATFYVVREVPRRKVGTDLSAEA